MWYLSQIGRREHYRLAAELHALGRLKVMYTDVWAPWSAALPSWLRPTKLAQRHHAALRNADVRSPPLWRTLAGRLGGGQPADRWVAEGLDFGRRCAKVFDELGFTAGDVVFGYTCANLEQLRLAQVRGAKGLHVQVDPGAEWYDLRTAEQAAHPDREDPMPAPAAGFFDRCREEMSVASRVIVHSPHSLRSLERKGLPAGRAVVIPPAFGPSGVGRERTLPAGRPLRILYVGSVTLMKGFHDFAAAARLVGAACEFVAAGQPLMRRDYLDAVSRDVRLLGHLSQAGLRREMSVADALVFPSLSDGFGLVQLEAMDMGLPVIATSCCGEVVRPGLDGFVIPPRSPESIAAGLAEWLRRPDLYAAHSRSALSRPADFSARRHLEALTGL